MGPRDDIRTRTRLACGLLSLLPLFSIPNVVRADDHGVTFLFPTRGLTFHQLDIVNVTYLSPFPQPNLYIFCDGGGRQVDVRPAAPYNGSVLELLNFTSTTDCWFDLRPGTEAGHGANSESFKLLSDERIGTTVGLPQPSTTSSSSSTSTSSSTSSSSAVQSTASPVISPSPSSGSSGISSGAAAGIGVGVSLGVIAIAGAAAAFWWRRRRRSKAGAPPVKAEHHGSDGAGYPDHGYRRDTPSPPQQAEYKTPIVVARPYAPVEAGYVNAPTEMPGELDRRPELP